MRIWLDKTVDEEFEDLGTQGHTGTLNDRQFTFLATLGHTGALADRMGSFIAGGRVVDITAPVVVTSSYDNGTGALALNITEASGSATCYWALVANPSTPTTAQVKAGTGGGILEAGSFTVTSGGDSDIISLTGPSGNELHLVIEDASGNNTGTPSAGNNTVITGVSFPASTIYSQDFTTDQTAATELTLETGFTATAETARGPFSFPNNGSQTGALKVTSTSTFVNAFWYVRAAQLSSAIVPGNSYNINVAASVYKNTSSATTINMSVHWIDNADAVIGAALASFSGDPTQYVEQGKVDLAGSGLVAPAGAVGIRVRMGANNWFTGNMRQYLYLVEIEAI